PAANRSRNGQFDAGFVEAMENHVTLGEISEELRNVFGLFKETITL
ncbi:MAG: hypothetical protein HC902_12680, partial [Calothrix sp. SM1_5_4]|nr:hypothetical protein [Calothrix sp. SM1_5_4]